MKLCFVILACVLSGVAGDCSFQGIFNLGDSNSDTGSYYSAFPPLPSPYGITFFNRPVERLSDGRLIIDFLATAVGIPLLSAYLRSVGSNFSHGANFATAGSTVLEPKTTYATPFFLDIQLQQLKHFKEMVDNHTPDADVGSQIPAPDIFGKSIYTIYIGQNDFTRNALSCGVETLIQQQVVTGITTTIKEIYNTIGGRTFFVFNLAPVGCYPFTLVQSRNSSDVDPVSGCLISCNAAVDAYNSLLRGALDQARRELPEDADLIHVDIHAILLNIFNNRTAYGMEYATRACCGYGGGPYNFQPQVVYCGYTGHVGGQEVNATVCSDRHEYVNWDGIHLTEAANRIVAEAVLTGSYFDPPFPFAEFCDFQPVG